MTDPISDMLNRIRNAQTVLQPTVELPFSKIKYEIAKILKKQGLVEDAEEKGKKIGKTIKITLKYQKETLVPGGAQRLKPVIFGLKKISKPGQRIYIKRGNIKPVRAGYGISIISTSRGLMTGKEARRQRLGGEVICEIW